MKPGLDVYLVHCYKNDVDILCKIREPVEGSSVWYDVIASEL